MIARYIASQLRRPSGWFGRWVMTRLLNSGNAELINATLATLDLTSSDHLLDVGFGGGGALLKAAEVVRAGALIGIDFSPDVVAQGQRRHRGLISSGKLRLEQGDVAELPIDDGAVAKLVTTNTIYFWPDPEGAARELLRVLAPGGKLAMGYTGGEKMNRYDTIATTERGFTAWNPADVENLLLAAGFESVETLALRGKRTRGDFVTTARRPRAPR